MLKVLDQRVYLPTYRDELRPCPACGAEAYLKQYQVLSAKAYGGKCCVCEHSGGIVLSTLYINRQGTRFMTEYDARQEAVKLWNEEVYHD